MSATVLERDMLKTRVAERGLDVTTFLNQRLRPPCRHPWTAVWGPRADLLWLHFWRGPTTPGGLAEAHESVVARVARGEIPAQAQQQDETEEAHQHAQLAAATE